MNTTTETVAALRDGMTRAASAASKSGPDILGGFCERLCMRVELEDEKTQVIVTNIVGPILDTMAEEGN